MKVPVVSRRTQWATPLILSGVVALLVVGAYFYVRVLHLEQAQTLASNDAIARGVAASIEAREQGYLDVLRAYAGRFRFREAIKQQDRAEALVHLQQLVEWFPDLGRAFLAEPAGVVWAAYPEVPEVYGQSFAHRDWYQGVSRAWQPYMSEVFEGATADRPLVVVLAAPVRGLDDRVIGIIGSAQSLETIRQWLLPIQIPGGDLYVVDRKGQFVFHRTRVGGAHLADYARTPAVERLRRGEAGIAELENPVEQERRLNAYRVLPTLDWGVVVYRTKDLALERTRRLMVVSGTAGLGLLVALGILGVVALRAHGRTEAANAQLRAEIADRRRAEAEAVQAREEANRANRLKSEFLANMLHELRTPLNGIIGFAELLHDGKMGPVSSDQQEFLGDILTSARHLLRLINDVLDLAKVESGTVEFQPEPVDLTRLVGEVRDVLRAVAARKRIRLETAVDLAIGSVVLDPAKLKQVLYNYLSNAIKFTPDEGRVTIRVTPEAPDHVRFEVEDTGIGIPPDQLDRLFVEFQQLDAGPGRRDEGTGLGLALTKRLVEAQGGRVGVRSTPGHGSVFFAVLPQVTQPAEAPADGSAVPGPAPVGTPTILVIEDEARDRAWLTRVLTEAGYAVEAVASGADAVARARARRFDAITLDLLLPDWTAHDLMAALRAAGPNRETPVVVVTVVAEREAAAGFLVHDFLTKPVPPEDLLRSLAAAGVTPEVGRPILVVDDDPDARRLAEVAFTELGFRVVCAASGAAGLEAAAAAEPPAAIVLDLLMPEMDGFEFLSRFRATRAAGRAPVLVWTAKTLTAEDRRRLDGAVARVVTKGDGGARPLLEALAAVVRPAGT